MIIIIKRTVNQVHSGRSHFRPSQRNQPTITSGHANYFSRAFSLRIPRQSLSGQAGTLLKTKGPGVFAPWGPLAAKLRTRIAAFIYWLQNNPTVVYSGYTESMEKEPTNAEVQKAAQIMGRVKSERKAAAARRNGQKGGRPVGRKSKFARKS